MSTDYKFEGWMGLDADSAKGNMVWQEYEPKPWEETDVDIKVTNSGICGSDIHTLRSGWVCLSLCTLEPPALAHRAIPNQVANGASSVRAKLPTHVLWDTRSSV